MKKTKTKTNRPVWVVVSDGDFGKHPFVTPSLDCAMDYIDTLRDFGVPDSKIAFYEAAKVPLPKW